MTPNPAVWFQRPDGAWYKHSNPTIAHYAKICERCGEEFLGRLKARYCTPGCSKRKDDPTYSARHRRVEAARGKASNHPCVDNCGKQAQDWTQIHGTTGLEPEHYEPRCRSCHRQYDGNTRLTDAEQREVLASVGTSNRALAQIFGVSESTIRRVKKNRAEGARI